MDSLHGGWVTDLHFSPDNSLLVSTGGYIKVWQHVQVIQLLSPIKCWWNHRKSTVWRNKLSYGSYRTNSFIKFIDLLNQQISGPLKYDITRALNSLYPSVLGIHVRGRGVGLRATHLFKQRFFRTTSQTKGFLCSDRVYMVNWAAHVQQIDPQVNIFWTMFLFMTTFFLQVCIMD